MLLISLRLVVICLQIDIFDLLTTTSRQRMIDYFQL